jgi:hypothetical protein
MAGPNLDNTPIAPVSLIIPYLPLAKQTATISGAIILSGALLCYYNGTRWVILDEVD